MGHPDFRVRGKIFATLGPDEVWAMVKLPPDVQAALVERDPSVYSLAKGAWGAQGSTIVQLRRAEARVVKEALAAAWRHVAPKGLSARRS